MFDVSVKTAGYSVVTSFAPLTGLEAPVLLPIKRYRNMDFTVLGLTREVEPDDR